MLIYTAEDWIQDSIITHFEKLLNGTAIPQQLPWFDIESSLDVCIAKGSGYMAPLHRMMQPYYLMYITGDDRLCTYNLHNVRQFFNKLISADKDFALWASQQDLIMAAEGWGYCLKRMVNDHVGYFFDVLEALGQSECSFDWMNLSEELQAMLFKQEVYSDYKTDELLCILHAFSMIMQQQWNHKRKLDNFYLLRDYWGFLKYYYSLMIRHIVGSKLTNFIAISNTVALSSSNHPHMLIYYCALLERVDSFHYDIKKFKKIDQQCLRLREIIDRVDQSDILYELCDALFPEDFQRMLNEHRPKTYEELEDENKHKDEIIKRMENQAKLVKRENDKMIEALKAGVEASIPVKYIEHQLMDLPPYQAWDMFCKLNSFFEESETWRKYDLGIRKKLKARLQAKEDREEKIAKALEEPKAKTVVNLELVQKKETNIDNNYGPNIEHCGGTIALPGTKEIEDVSYGIQHKE